MAVQNEKSRADFGGCLRDQEFGPTKARSQRFASDSARRPNTQITSEHPALKVNTGRVAERRKNPFFRRSDSLPKIHDPLALGQLSDRAFRSSPQIGALPRYPLPNDADTIVGGVMTSTTHTPGESA